MKAGDAIAIFNLGTAYSSGIRDYPQEHVKGLKLWHQAGEFGLAAANCNIGFAYYHGADGVESDMKKANITGNWQLPGDILLQGTILGF